MITPPIIVKSKKAHPLESKVELYFKREVAKIGGKSYKFNSENRRGVSDQIVIIGGRVIFVEMKRVNGKMSKLQEVFRSEIINKGGECVTCYGHAGVDGFIKDVNSARSTWSIVYKFYNSVICKLQHNYKG